MSGLYDRLQVRRPLFLFVYAVFWVLPGPLLLPVGLGVEWVLGVVGLVAEGVGWSWEGLGCGVGFCYSPC